MKTPTRYWVTTGTGESNVSLLDAIDKAYMEAGTAFQNHVQVSSIPPVNEISPRIDSEKGITFVPVKRKWRMIPYSQIIHVIQSLKTGIKGEELSSSISLVKISVEAENRSQLCLLAYESTGSNLKETEDLSIKGVDEMAKRRNGEKDMSWGNQGVKTISSYLCVKKEFGCSVAFIVFDPFTYEEKNIIDKTKNHSHKA